MIWLISDRLERGRCDDVLEVAWSTMWNVTDETPPNCRKFLDNKGMELFLKCLEVSFSLRTSNFQSVLVFVVPCRTPNLLFGLVANEIFVIYLPLIYN